MARSIAFSLIAACCLLVVLASPIVAQSILPAANLRVIAKLAPGTEGVALEISPDSVQALLATATLQYTCVVTLADTTGIASVQVALGTTDGGSELTLKSFVFDGPATLADGSTYRRKGKMLWLGIGAFTGVPHYFAEVRLADATGLLTAPVKTSR